MNILMRYREAVAFYGLAAVVLTAIAAYPDGDTNNDGARCCVHSIPSVSPSPATSITTTLNSSATPGPVPTTESPSTSPSSTAEPTTGPTRIPTPTVTRTVTFTPQPSVSISISISASPTLPVPIITPPRPHNKALGLKDGCLVQKKKWLLKVPCPQAHQTPEESVG